MNQEIRCGLPSNKVPSKSGKWLKGYYFQVAETTLMENKSLLLQVHEIVTVT